MEYEARISVAFDPRSKRLINIYQAEERTKYYTCKECGEFLQVRHGKIRTWYFAHSKREGNSPPCTLRTEIGIRNLEEELRVSPVEVKEKNYILNLGIIPDQYSKMADLVAVVKTPDWDEFRSEEDLKQFLITIKVSGKGIIGPVDPTIFHPRNPVAYVYLDPNSEEYELTIDTAISIKAFTGKWIASGLREGDLFAGGWDLAERLDVSNGLRESDITFQIKGNSVGATSNEVYTIGNKLAIEKTASEFTREQDRLTGTGLGFNIMPFEVDVIYPPNACPSSHNLVTGPPEGNIVIAIIPKNEIDPEFEIVTVPRSDDYVTIEPSGPGKPRFYQTHFPKKGSKRISVHLKGNHVFLQLFATEKIESLTVTDKNEDLLALKITEDKGEPFLVFPWKYDNIFVEQNKIPEFEVIGQLSEIIPIEALAYGEKVQQIVPEIIYPANISLTVKTWFDEGAKSVLISFGEFGRIKIDRKEDGQKFTLDTIIRIAKEKKIDPKVRVTWAIVRVLTGTESGTLHKDLSKIISKKMVRDALRKMRVENLAV